jgi:nucleoside-diphosphate-sugar epimerase
LPEAFSTVLVIGGFGFIGAHVVRELLMNKARVLVIDRERVANSVEDVLDRQELESIELLAAAIPDARELERLLRHHSVGVVVHLASPLSTMTEANPRLTIDDMIVPQLEILEACRNASVPRLVWASSVGVFGRVQQYPEGQISNDAPQYPFTLYGAAKAFLERLSVHETVGAGVETVGLRFPLVYGPGRKRGNGLFSTELIEGAALGRRCIVEAGDTKNDWMYVADAARSVLRAMQATSLSSGALTVGGDVASTREVAELLLTWFPDAEVDVLPGTGDDLVFDFDPGPARRELGYTPAYTLREGVLATANAARRRAGIVEIAA